MLCGAAAFLLCLPFLATTAQNGDGLELVRVVESHGAPHPPGFPLQVLLDELVALLPLGTVAWRISLLSALAHGVAVACTAEAAGRLGSSRAPSSSPLPRLVGGALFALAPVPWSLAVQPEVFAVAHALFAAMLLVGVALDVDDTGGATPLRAAMLGALVGAAAGSHPLTVLAAPLFLAAAFHLVKRSARGVVTFVVMGLVFVVVVLVEYAALVRAPRAPWPGWGELHGTVDVLRHALRADYGGALETASRTGAESTRGIDVLLRQAMEQPVLALLVVVAAAIGVARARRRTAALVAASGLLALAVVVTSSLPAPLADAAPVLERFFGPLFVVVAVLAGAAAGATSTLPRLTRLAVPALLALVAAGAAVFLADDVDASRDHTLDVLARAEGVALPPDSIFLAAEDVECMGGAVLDDGRRRDPVCAGVLSNPWYQRRLSVIEPRLVGAGAKSALDVVAWSRARGLVVTSPHQELLAGAGPLTARGPLVVVGVAPAFAGGPAVEAARRVCPLLVSLEPLPRGRHAFTEGAWLNLARGFDAAAAVLGATEAGQAAALVADGLRQGVDASTWRDGCGRFAAALDGARGDR